MSILSWKKLKTFHVVNETFEHSQTENGFWLTFKIEYFSIILFNQNIHQ